MTDSDQVENVVPDEVFIKSENDTDRTYRGLTLKNGLKVILISDHTAKFAAASLHVSTGACSDPKEVPGIAHFLEHMLFLGTEKYPEEADYNEFIRVHGGMSNASTSIDFTNFFFTISADQLPGALERFSSFFICPLFTEGSTNREIQAIEEEFRKNYLVDATRVYTLSYSLVDKDHDFNRFCSGNRKSLHDDCLAKKIDIREKLLEFYNQNYSSHIMSLSILGKDPIEKLEELAVSLFSPIKRNDSAHIKTFTNPFASESQLKKMLRVVPTKDIRQLSIRFNCPWMVPYYRCNQGHFISHLIGHEGSGSLLRYFQKRDLVVSLESSCYGHRGFGNFDVSLVLTRKGLDSIWEITQALFQYINMLKESLPQKWLYDEIRLMSDWFYKFKEKETDVSLVTKTSSLLHTIPFEHILKFGRFFDEYNEELITEFLTYLNPDNVRLSLMSQSVGDLEGLKTEEWFGTKYTYDDIPEEVVAKWKSCGTSHEFHLPPKNVFIPENLSLQPLDCSGVPKYPQLILESELCKLWHKQDDKFLVPKATIVIIVRIPCIVWHPLNINLTRIFLAMYENFLQELLYDAQLAGVHCAANPSTYGCELSFKGLSEKLTLLVEKVIESFVSFTADDQQLFESFKDLYTKSVENSFLSVPYKYVSNLINEAIFTPYFSYQNFYDFLPRCTLELMNTFTPRIFDSMHFELMVYGNISAATATNLCHSIENVVKTKRGTQALLPAELVWRPRWIRLPDRSYHVYVYRSPIQPTHGLLSFYQTGPQTIPHLTILDLYAQIFMNRIFDEIRTKKQQVLESLSSDEFNNYKSGLRELYLEEPKSLSAQSYLYWSEIGSGQYNFERRDQKAAFLESIQKNDVIEFHNEYFAIDGPQRRKFAVHMLPKKATGNAGDSQPQHQDEKDPIDLEKLYANVSHTIYPKIVKNLEKFKAHLPLCPLMEPVAT